MPTKIFRTCDGPALTIYNIQTKHTQFQLRIPVFIVLGIYIFGLSFDSLVDLHTKIEMHSQATLFSCVFQLVFQVSLVYIYSVEQYYLQ